MNSRILVLSFIFLSFILLANGQPIDSNPLLFNNGGSYNDYSKAQIAFGWYYNQKYAHRISSRHHSSDDKYNALDFYLWHVGQGSAELGNKHVMTLSTIGVGIGTFNPTADLQLYHDSQAGSPTFKLTKIGSNPGGSFTESWRFELERNNSLYTNSLTFFHENEKTSTTTRIAQFLSDRTLLIGKIKDINNQNYFLDPASTGTSLKVAGTISAARKIVTEEIEVKDIASLNIRTDDLKTNSLNLKVENVADYVFEDEYNLLSLTEVERFIENYKHLPDIPSGKELEDSGMDVAKMNNLLLQKIEELTLYLIAQQKELDELKSMLK